MIFKKNKYGFTFIEVVVVISILAILATIWFVSFRKYTKDARDSSKITTLKSISNGIDLLKVKWGKLPLPDHNYVIQKWFWKLNTGIIWESIIKYIDMDKIPTDPESWVEFSYSTHGKQYEVGTAVLKNTNVWYLNPTYAATEEKKALLTGNFNGYFVRYHTGWINYYMSTPSITLSDLDANITVGRYTTGIVINGENNLPYPYEDLIDPKRNNTTKYTPNILYAGTSCGPETYDDILWFFEILNDSFKGIINEKSTKLQELTTADEKVEFTRKLLNSVGWCNIIEPKIPDISPTKCWWRDGTFEMYDHGDTLPWNCMFLYSGSGAMTVTNGAWSGSTKWLVVTWRNTTSVVRYKLTSKIPFKLNFDLKTLFTSYDTTFSFLINGIDYRSYNTTNNSNTAFSHFESPLLASGSYEFSWNFKNNNSTSEKIIIDNVLVSCLWGWTDCWITDFTPDNSLEVWDTLLTDMFEFTWDIKTPWMSVTWASNVTDGEYSLKNPTIPNGEGVSYVTLKRTFNTPQKFSFDIKTELQSFSNAIFYINGIEYLFYSGNGSSDGIHESWQWNANDGFKTFSTPLLPAWDYEFKWKITKRYSYVANIRLDNMKFSCLWWGPWCWVTDFVANENSLELWEYPLSDIFTFTGIVSTPWKSVTWATNVSDGEYAIKSPTTTDGISSMILNQTFDTTKKFSFDIKTELSQWSNVIFYINGTEYLFYSGNGSSNGIHESWQGNANDGFKTFSTPLLPAWDYEFKWSVNRRYGVTTNIWLDNMKFSCIWWGPWCGVTNFVNNENSFESWENALTDMFSFEWIVTTPWKMVSGTWNSSNGTYAIKSPTTWDGVSNMILNKTLTTAQRIRFDVKTEVSQWSNMIFYINGIEYLFYSGNGSTDQIHESWQWNANDGFKTFTSPMLPPGDYEFTWSINRRYGTTANVWIDNMWFECETGGSTCWITAFTPNNPIELWNTLPWNIFSFSWAISTPWKMVTGSWEANTSYAIKSPTLKNGQTTSMSLVANFAQPQKLNFDIKTNFDWGSNAKFFINDRQYDVFNGVYPDSNNWFVTYSTPLLPAWDYTFRFEVYAWRRNNLTLDNITFTCVWWGSNCGITTFSPNNSLEPGNTFPWDIFTYSWDISMPWNLVTQPWFVSDGTYSMRNPILQDNGTAYIALNKTLSTPQKFSFDIKTQMTYYWNASFYINGIEYESYNYQSVSNNWFTTFTTPLLPAGNYEFKWRVYRWANNTSNIYIDNLKFNCDGGWNWCWVSEIIENWNTHPWNMFTFTGSVNTPWKLVDDSGSVSNGTYALKNPILPDNTNSYLVLNKTFSSPQKFSFDIKTQLTYYWNVSFYINDIEYESYNYQSVSNAGFVTFNTPLLPAWNYEFKWRVYKGASNTAHIYLDNFNFTCNGGGAGCWITWFSPNNSIEVWPNNPWNVFTFTGSVSIPWMQSSSYSSDGLYSLKNPIIPENTDGIVLFNKTVSANEKLSFDIRTSLTYSTSIKFYVDGIQKQVYDYNNASNAGFVNFTTTALTAWNHEFKWIIRRATYNNATMYLDNLKFIP